MKPTVSVRDTAAALRAMPFFRLRFLLLSLEHIANDLARICGPDPEMRVWTVVCGVIAALAAIGFLVPEILVLKRDGIKDARGFRAPPLLLWYALCLLCLVAEAVNGCVLYSPFLLLLPLFVLFGQEPGFFRLYLASFLPSVVFHLVLGIAWFPLVDNTFALCLAASGIVLLSVGAQFLIHPTLYGRLILLVPALFLAALLYFAGVSGGRTGFLALIAAAAFFLSGIIIKRLIAERHRPVRQRFLTLLLLAAILVLVLLTVFLFITLDDGAGVREDPLALDELNIAQKFETAMENGNMFSSRGMIWKQTFRDTRFFGHGTWYYLELGQAGVLAPQQNSAHNSFLAFWGQCGPLAFVLYLCFCVLILIRSVRYCLSHRHLFLFPFLTLSVFFTASITEDIAFSFGPRCLTLLFYAACALLLRDRCFDFDPAATADEIVVNW